MSTTKVTDLTELTSAADDDVLLISDVDAALSKKIQKSNITEQNFTTTLKTKLDGIEASATADQTGAEIKTAYEGEADTNAFTDAEKTKLSGIETGADVTDTANVTSAGALMDSEVTNLDQVKSFDSTDYATSAQGTKADSALQSSDIGTSVQAYSSVLAGTTASFTTADETKLDGIEASADVTDTTNVVAALTAGTNITIAGDGTISATDTDTGILNVSEDTTPQLGGNLDTNGNDVNFGDSDKAQFGASDDLQIFHDGTHSYIREGGTGNLKIQANALELKQNTSDERFMYCNPDAGVTLYYDNSTKLQTTADGVDILGNGALKLPVGTTAQQPASPTAGDLRWNSDDTSAEIYDGSAWGSVGGGGAATTVYSEHAHTLSENTSIASGNNAVSGGPITIGSGYSVTVPTGSTWTIV